MKLNYYENIKDLNDSTIFRALDRIFRKEDIDSSTATIGDMKEALAHICFGNYPLTIQFSKERLVLIIREYSQYSDNRIYLRDIPIRLEDFELNF